MAGKKKAKAGKRSKAVGKAKPQAVAVKVLGELPALDTRLRDAYRACFTEEQCRAWGETTKAAKVIDEAEKWITTINGALKRGPMAGYTTRRLAWLCENVVELRDELAASTSKDGAEARGARISALQVALRACADLRGRLRLVAAGRDDLQLLVTDRDLGTAQPSDVRDTLAGFIDLASRWRKDPRLFLLAEDAELSEARLSAAYNAMTILTRANEAAWDAAPATGDAASVNLIEGRVLRELVHAHHAFTHARVVDRGVPALPPGPSIRAVLGKPMAVTLQVDEPQ